VAGLVPSDEWVAMLATVSNRPKSMIPELTENHAARRHREGLHYADHL